MKHPNINKILTKQYLPLVILAVAILISFLMIATRADKAVIDKKEQVWKVDVIPVELKSIAPEITIYGRVETPNTSTLTSALSAEVLKVHVRDGSDVTKGDSLVELETIDFDLLVSQRKADLAEINGMIESERQRYKRDNSLLENEKKLVELAKAEIKRASKLANSGLASQSSYDDALTLELQRQRSLKNLQYDINNHDARLAQLNAKKQQAEALLKQAKIDLQRCTIVAPFSGRVSKLDVSIGDRVRVGSPLVSLYDLSALEVRAQIPRRYEGELRKLLASGKEIEAIARVDEQVIQLKLIRLSGEVQAGTGGIDGLFRLVNESESSLALGTFVSMKMKLAIQDGLIDIPHSALYELNHVYVIDAGYMKRIDLKRHGEYTNQAGQQRLLISSSSLSQGEQIVTTQLPNAITGLRVEASND